MKLSDFPAIIFASSKISNGNMSFLRGDKNEALENRRKFLQVLDINLNDTVCANLEHGKIILSADDSDKGKGTIDGKSGLSSDGLITNNKNLFLFMVVADCLPLAFFDPKSRALCLVHASRANLDLGIINEVVKKFLQEFKTKSEDLIVEIGPSVGPCCYSWHPDYTKDFDQRWKSYIHQQNDKFTLDIWQFVEDELKKAGLLMENITNQKICTYHLGEYFSHRKSMEQNQKYDYRLGVVLGLKN